MSSPVPEQGSGLAPAGSAALATLPQVTADRPSAVLLVELSTRRVVHANQLAQQLAPGASLPATVDDWSRAAGLCDLQGRELTATDHPLSLAAAGQPVSGQPVTARRASEVSEVREPLFAIGLPLAEAPGLQGHALVVLLPLRDAEAVAAVQRTADAESHVRERAVLATGIAFTVADATAPDLPLVWVNPAFTATTGYSAQEALGRNCRFLQGPDTDPAAVQCIRDAVQQERDLAVTLLNYRKDGTAFWNLLAMSPVRDARGTLTHFVGVQTDVTGRVQADQARDEALRAERRARAEAEEARATAEQATRTAEQATRTAEQATRAAEQAVAETELARAEAVVLSGRLGLVAEATALLSATLDVDESLDRLTRLVVPLLADWAVITLADEQGRARTPALARHREGQEELLGRYAELVPDVMAPGNPLRDLLDGGPAYYRPHLDALDEGALDEGELPEAEREMREIGRQLGAGSVLAVPLVARRRVLGVLMLVHGPSGRVFTQDDVDLATDLGRRAGLAIDNARLYTREHRTAVTLQRGLLPSLPEVAGLDLAAAYLPAASGNQVGGDWWDVFELPDGATAVAIGDVMGHDIAAAAAMGQLRSVLRTCAWQGDPPATVLDRMDRLVQGFEMAQLATCFYARLQPADGPEGRRRLPRLSWSNAGHLPPLLLDPEGAVQLLRSGGSVPLGVPDDEDRTHADLSLRPGSTLLLYTDGLVESRTGDIDTDIAALVTKVRAHSPADGPRVLVDALSSSLHDLADDVALLAVRLR